MKLMTPSEVYNASQPIIAGQLSRICELVGLQYRLQKYLGFNIRYDLSNVPWSYIEYLLSEED